MTADSTNRFFAANLLFRALRDGKSCDDNLWEESIVLIEASTAEDAASKAEALGQAGEHSYSNGEGVLIFWTFVKTDRIFEIGQALAEGVELFSRFLITPQVESLLGRTNQIAK